MPPAHPATTRPLLKPRDRVGAYEVSSQLSAGDHSVVYRAEDPLLGRAMVLKQLGSSMSADDPRRGRFERWIADLQSVARDEPHLIAPVELIDDPRGPFLLVPFVKGESLEQRLIQRGGPVPPVAVVRWLRGLVAALRRLHGAGLSHGQIKPSHVIITPEGSARLLDAGFLEVVEAEEAASSAADAASDWHELGRLAYELLVGRSAYEDLVGGSRSREGSAHRRGRGDRLPPLDRIEPNVPERLRRLVARLLACGPGQSLPDPHGVERELAAIAGDGALAKGSSVSGGAASAARPARGPRRATRRRRVATAVAVALGVTVLVAGIGAAVTYHRAQQEQREVRHRLDEADELYRAGRFMEARDIYARIADQTRFDVSARYAQAGTRRAEARLALEAGQFDRAERALRDALAMDVFDPDRLREELATVRERAGAAARRGEVEAALQAGRLDEAHRLLESWRAADPSAASEALIESLAVRLEAIRLRSAVAEVVEQAEGLAREGEREAAIKVLQEAEARYAAPELREALDRLQRRALVEQALRRAERAETQQRWADAIVAYREALAVRSDPGIEARLERVQATAWIEQGRRRLRSGDRPGAIDAFTRALAYGGGDEARFWLRRLDVTVERDQLVAAGDLAMGEGEFEAAIRHYTRAAALSSSGTVDPAIHERLREAKLQHWLARGDRHLAREEFEAALEAYRQARREDDRSREADEGVQRAQRWLSYRERFDRGDKLRAEGRFGLAAAAYREAQEHVDTPRVRDRLEAVEYEHHVAQAYVLMSEQRWDAARAMLQNARRIRETQQVERLIETVKQGQADDDTTIR